VPFPDQVQASGNSAGVRDLSAYSDVFIRPAPGRPTPGSARRLREALIKPTSAHLWPGLDFRVVHMLPKRLGAVAVAAKAMAHQSYTTCYIAVLLDFLPGDQDLTDLFPSEQRQAFRRSDRGFSTYLSTRSVGISKITTAVDGLPDRDKHRVEE
jgi:hypothetical protein